MGYRRERRYIRSGGIRRRLAGTAIILSLTAGLLIGCTKEDKSVDYSASSSDKDVVTWEGASYEYNPNISNYLFLGVDTEGIQETKKGQADAGQADALFLLAVDRKEGIYTRISIPRDTMTKIESFDVEGNSLGTGTDHISLSYGFGDGRHESCKLTQEAVSNLMYQLPIQGYCAINLEALPTLADTVGEVTVTVPDDSLTDAGDIYGQSYEQGEELVLNADNIETFVRYRDVDQEHSAINRLNRQQVFLDAYEAKLRERMSEDSSFAATLYEELTPYLVTNMNQDRLLKLFEEAQDEKKADEWVIPGEAVEGHTYDEYHVDDSALYEKIIETFYRKVEE